MKYLFNPATITVDYDEIGPSPTIRLGEHGMEESHVYRCAWSDRYLLMRELTGRLQTFSNEGISVVVPHALQVEKGGYIGMGQYAKTKTWLHCRNVEVKGFGDPSGGTPTPTARESIPAGQGIINYAYAEVTATYDDGPWFMDERLDLGGEVVALSGGKAVELYWRSDHKLLDKQVVHPLFNSLSGLWRVTFFALAYVPDVVFTMRGKVNSEIVTAARLQTISIQGTVKHREFAAGTLLYNGASVQEAYLPLGRLDEPIRDTPYYRIDLEFGINENTWNTFFRPGEGSTGTWDALDKDVLGASPYNPYVTADLRQLIGRDA